MAKNVFDRLMSVGVDMGKDALHLVGMDHTDLWRDMAHHSPTDLDSGCHCHRTRRSL